MSGEHPTIPMPEPTQQLIRELKETMRKERRAARVEWIKRVAVALVIAYTILGSTAGLFVLGWEMWRTFK